MSDTATAGRSVDMSECSAIEREILTRLDEQDVALSVIASQIGDTKTATNQLVGYALALGGDVHQMRAGYHRLVAVTRTPGFRRVAVAAGVAIALHVAERLR